MQTISAKNRQSLLDIATEFTGTAENVFALAFASGMSITDELNSASVVIIPDVEKEETTMQTFEQKKIHPATALITATAAEPEPQGIGYWAIGQNFKVS